MIDQPFRNWLSNKVSTLLWIYRTLHLTPNAITMAGLLVATLAAYFCAQGEHLLAGITWWLSRIFDGTDGIYARFLGQSSLFGAYLDIVCDMAAYALMILGFAWRHPHLQWHWIIIMSLYVLCIASALALGSLSSQANIPNDDNRGLRFGAGLAEGGETGIAYTLFLIFPEHLNVLLPSWIGILLITVISRSLLARRLLNTPKVS